MLSTAVTGAGSSRGVITTSMLSKDDSFTDIRIKHHSGDSRQETMASSDFPGPLPEFRSRHRSANVKSPPSRLNIYKRETATAPTSPRIPHEDNNNHDSSAFVLASDDGLRSPKPFKREGWFQRSWRVAKSHRPQTQSNYHLSTEIQPKAPIGDRSPNDTGLESGKKSPIGPGGKPLAGLLERLRPRSGTDALSAERLSTSQGTRRKKGWTNVESPRSTRTHAAPPRAWIYERRGSSPCGSPMKDIGEDDVFGSIFTKDRSLSPVRRKRSSSDTAKYIIMRKTSRPHTAEVVGSISRRDVPYKQLLKKFTCYDLMPTQGALVAIDSELSTRLALTSLAENGVRAGFIWDSRQRAPSGLITVTDFLRIMYSHFSAAASPIGERSNGRARQSQEGNNQMQANLEDVLDRPVMSNLGNLKNADSSKFPKRHMLITISSEDTLLSALTVLRLNRLHRIPVLEAETNNPLYLLSTKRLLYFLCDYMPSLPMSMAMYKSLEELRIGTWISGEAGSLHPVISLTADSSMADAVEKFLQSGASSLPIVRPLCSTDKCSEFTPKFRLVDALTKVDLMHFVLVNGWNDLHEKTVTHVLLQRDKAMERLITCHRKTTLALAIDRLVLSQAHRLYIIDSDACLQGIMSVGDLLSFLNDKAPDDMVQKK